jgi:predicted nucleotide-binding protein
MIINLKITNNKKYNSQKTLKPIFQGKSKKSNKKRIYNKMPKKKKSNRHSKLTFINSKYQ